MVNHWRERHRRARLPAIPQMTPRWPLYGNRGAFLGSLGLQACQVLISPLIVMWETLIPS